jgi:hypothetical protein
MGNAFSFPAGQTAGSQVDHSTSSRVEVKNAWSYTSTPPTRIHGVVLHLCLTVRFFWKRTTRMYPKFSGLAAWSENCKWYSSLPLGAVYRYFVSQSSEFCRHNPLCSFLTSVYCYFVIDWDRKLLDTPLHKLILSVTLYEATRNIAIS